MLLVTTTRCDMGCRHCMVDCTAQGEDISWNNYKTAVECIDKIDNWLLLTGGEPLMHPAIDHMIDYALEKTDLIVILTTNGKYLAENEEHFKYLLEKYDQQSCIFPRFQIQITHDKRYYPQKIDMKPVQRLTKKYWPCMYVNKLISMCSLGRAKTNGIRPYGRKAPMCSNVLLVANQTDNCREMIAALTMARKLCHLTVMPNMDIMMCECRQVKLTNMVDDCFWPETCYEKLRMKNFRSLACNKCNFGNQEIFTLVEKMREVKTLGDSIDNYPLRYVNI